MAGGSRTPRPRQYPSASAKFAVSEALYGGPLPRDLSSSVERFFNGIQIVLDNNGGLPIRGRIGGMRVNFDLDAGDVTSIRYRLYYACSQWKLSPTFGGKDPRMPSEWLLRALVVWARQAFDEMPGVLPPEQHKNISEDLMEKSYRYVQSCTDDYGDCLAWLGDNMTPMRPLISENETAIVEYLLASFRQHIFRIAKTGKRFTGIQDVVVQEVQQGEYSIPNFAWSLYHTRGFERVLRRCFKNKSLASEQYEDSLERAFYLFRCAMVDGDKPDADKDVFELEKSAGVWKLAKQEASDGNETWLIDLGEDSTATQ